MKKRKKKLVIEFSPEQTEKYFEIVSRKMTSEVGDDSLPSGIQIIINVIPPFSDHAIVNGIDIGDIDLDFLPIS